MTSAPQEDLSRAIEHYQAGRRTEAQSLCQRVLQAVPEQPMALTILGLSAYAAGALDEAADWQRRAVAATPDAAAVHYNLALT